MRAPASGSVAETRLIPPPVFREPAANAPDSRALFGSRYPKRRFQSPPFGRRRASVGKRAPPSGRALENRSILTSVIREVTFQTWNARSAVSEPGFQASDTTSAVSARNSGSSDCRAPRRKPNFGISPTRFLPAQTVFRASPVRSRTARSEFLLPCRRSAAPSSDFRIPAAPPDLPDTGFFVFAIRAPNAQKPGGLGE